MFEFEDEKDRLAEASPRSQHRTQVDVVLAGTMTDGRRVAAFIEVKLSELDFGTCSAFESPDRTLGPRWDRISDRQMEFLAALALHGGRASTASIAATLGRTQQELSWLRGELIEEGDIYAPKRGQLAMAVPLFNRYVLSHYERTRPEAAAVLLSLEEMFANAGLDASAMDGNGEPDALERARQTRPGRHPRPTAAQGAHAPETLRSTSRRGPMDA